MSDSFRCTLKSIVTPGLYWMTKYCEPHSNEYTELEQNISRDIRHMKHAYLKEEIEENEIVAVQHPSQRLHYFRALVKSIHAKSQKYAYKLFLIDHGIFVDAHRDKIEIIDNPIYRNKEPAAFKVRLYGVVPVQPMDYDPSSGESGFQWEISNKWMPAAMDFVKEQFNKYSEVYVKSRRTVDRTVIGDIYFKDEANGNVECLADLLIDNEYAIENSPKKIVVASSTSESASASHPSDLQEIQEVKAKLDRVREWRMQHMGANSLSNPELDEPWGNEYDDNVTNANEESTKEKAESPSEDEQVESPSKSARKNLLKLLRKSKESSSLDANNTSHNSESLKTQSTPVSNNSSNDLNQKLLKRLSLSCKARHKINGCDNVLDEADETEEFCDVQKGKSNIKIVLNSAENNPEEDEENDFDFEPNMPIRPVISSDSHLSETIIENVKPKLRPEHTILPAGKNLPETPKQGYEKRMVESYKISSDGQMEFEPWVLSCEPLPDYITSFKDILFVPEVSSNLEKLDFKKLLPLQRWSIPSIDRGVNVVMISPSETGKTISYVVHVINSVLCEKDLEENKIFALILCRSPENVAYIEELCLSLLSVASQSKIKILAVGNENIDDLQSANYQILITSPNIFVNFMKSSVKNLETLRYLILDDADQMKNPEEVVESILKGIHYKLLKKQCCSVIAGRRWTPEVEEIPHLLQKKFVHFMASSADIAVFNKVKCSVFYESDEMLKAQIVLNKLRSVVNKRRILILCYDKTETSLLAQYFTTIGHPALVIHEKRDKRVIKDDIKSWLHSKKDARRILLCTYNMIDKVQIKKTDYLVYYNLPTSNEEFESSLSRLNYNFRKCSEREDDSKKETEESSLMILVDDTYNPNLSVIVDLAKRLGAVIPPKVSELMLKCDKPPKLVKTPPKPKLKAEGANKKRDNTLHSMLFNSIDDSPKKLTNDSPILCLELLEVGKCEAKKCSYRHYFLKDLDSPKLPITGKMTFKIVHLENPISYWVRLLEHEDEATGVVTPIKDQSIEINIKLLNSYESEENRKRKKSIEIGDVVGVKCEFDLFYRGLILEFTRKNEKGQIIEVKVRRFERGDTKIIKVNQIYELPHDILKYPPQVTHVCLSSITRGENGAEPVNFIRNLISSGDQEKYVWSGRILFTLNYSLWLNTFEVLSMDDLLIDKMSIRDLFLQKNWVQENLDHLNILYQLFDESGIEYKKHEEKEEKKRIEPDWASFNEKFSRVVFLGAENTSSVFLQRSQFKKELEKLELECQKESEKIKKNDVKSSLQEGDYCLTYEKGKRRWRRARIECETSSGIDVFFVDYAEIQHVQPTDILPLPENLLTKLPFQAIECSLVGIKHTSDCDIQVINEIYNFSDMGETELYANIVNDDLVSKMVNSKKYCVNLLNLDGKSLNKILVYNSLVRCLKSEMCFVRDFDEISLEK